MNRGYTGAQRAAYDDALAVQGEIEAKHYEQNRAERWTLHQGDVLTELAKIVDESVNCVVTSPPYWSLRRYEGGDSVFGGAPECDHEWSEASKNGAAEGYAGAGRWQHGGHSRGETPDDWTRVTQWSGVCAKCGAWRGQLGLEPTPELYVDHTMMWLREARRVLRKDGVCWLNIGDSYAGSGRGMMGDGTPGTTGEKQRRNAGANLDLHDKRVEAGAIGRSWTAPPPGLKQKDLVLIPSRIALAAQSEGWWVRSIVVWHKPNPMPESVRDRPTDSHEYIVLLTKSARYWWDQEAVREAGTSGPSDIGPSQRNIRSVWTMPTSVSGGAGVHFATFPEELPRRCILASCPPGGLVLDPFTGTGTTGVVALRLGRRFAGIEISERYAEMARTKLELYWRDARVTLKAPALSAEQAALL